MKKKLIAIVCFVLIQALGCNNRLPMNGKVVFSDDQSPLNRGIVCFESPTYIARGELKSDGTYSIMSTSDQRGLPSGEYKVYIAGAFQTKGGKLKGVPLVEQIPLIDSKYTSPHTSGLVATVKRGTRTFDIAVDRPPK